VKRESVRIILSTLKKMPMQNLSLSCSLRSVSLLLTTFALALAFCVATATAQQKGQKNKPVSSQAGPLQPKLTRTTTRHEVRRLPYGSTLTLLGAPNGSITIEAWSRQEVDITADIELHADTEEDLTRLAIVNSFIIDDEPNQIHILTTGMHDKTFMRRTAKDFPKKLLALPWKIDYRLRVPALTDLDINNGRGAFNLTGVEGTISFQAQESDALIRLAGGTLRATLLRGSLRMMVASRSWRGVGASLQLASGDMTLELPAGFSGDIDADILRTGQIENNYAELTPRERTTPTPHSIKTRAGAGGVSFALTVGDGTIKINKAATPDD
jgi:hypothetical protein